MDIIAKLEDLHKQATTERSHYYVAACCRDAIAEVKLLRAALAAMIKVSETGVAEGLVDGHPDLEPVRQYLRHR